MTSTTSIILSSLWNSVLSKQRTEVLQFPPTFPQFLHEFHRCLHCCKRRHHRLLRSCLIFRFDFSPPSIFVSLLSSKDSSYLTTLKPYLSRLKMGIFRANNQSRSVSFGLQVPREKHARARHNEAHIYSKKANPRSQFRSKNIGGETNIWRVPDLSFGTCYTISADKLACLSDAANQHIYELELFDAGGKPCIFLFYCSRIPKI